MSADDPYRPPATPSQDPDTVVAESRSRFGFAAAMIAAVAAALFPSLLVPHVREMYRQFAFELPDLTRLVMIGYPLIWLLPLTVSAVWWARPQTRSRGRLAVMLGFVGAILAIALVALALYMPLIQLSRTL